MRSLNKKQKEIIQVFVEEQGLYFNRWAVLQELEKINDYETLNQDMDRYAEDYYNELWDKEIEKHILRG